MGLPLIRAAIARAAWQRQTRPCNGECQDSTQHGNTGGLVSERHERQVVPWPEGLVAVGRGLEVMWESSMLFGRRLQNTFGFNRALAPRETLGKRDTLRAQPL